MSALPTLVMETRLATTLMDLSCVCVIEALLVMDLIVQVCPFSTTVVNFKGVECFEYSYLDAAVNGVKEALLVDCRIILLGRDSKEDDEVCILDLHVFVESISGKY